MTEAPPITLRVPKLYPKQHAAIMCSERYGIIEASTKAGKTAGCITWLLSEAWKVGKDGREFWWVAPVYGQTEIAFRRLKRMLLRMDKSKTVWSSNDSSLTITLMNGARMQFRSAEKPDNLYGEDVWAVVMDEATRMREESWHAIRSTMTATKGPVRIIGNVKGRTNWVYKMARKAQMGDPTTHYAKITAYDAVEGGILDMAEIEDAKRVLPGDVFRELYLAEPTDDGGNPFGMDAIARQTRDDLAPGPVVAWGADLAKSQDWTVAIGLNESGDTCAFQRWQKSWLHTEKALAQMIGDTPACVDSTGVGSPVVEHLQKTCPLVEGVCFTQAEKQRLMGGLAMAIQSHGVTFPEGMIRQELEIFEYEYTRTGAKYSAPVGFHDDCVCALALAVRCFETRPAPVTVSIVEADGDWDADAAWESF